MPEERTYQRSRSEDIANAVNEFPALQEHAAAIVGKRRTGISEKEEILLQSVDDMRRHMAEAGVRPVTIMNSHPFEIKSVGRFCEPHVVPACPLGTAFVTYTIQSYDTDVVDTGGQFMARPILPLTIAKDILQQHEGNHCIVTGGLSLYMGDHAPNTNNQKSHDEARKRMEAHYRKMVQDANLAYTSTDKSGRKAIGDIHRQAARYLYHYRYIKELPAWVVDDRKTEDIVAVCPACGAEPKKGAYQCGQCGRIVDPAMAYEKGEISADHISLTFLSREQLKTLGISGLVKETVDERKARERMASAEVEPEKRKPGRPKKEETTEQ